MGRRKLPSYFYDFADNAWSTMHGRSDLGEFATRLFYRPTVIQQDLTDLLEAIALTFKATDELRTSEIDVLVEPDNEEAAFTF